MNKHKKIMFNILEKADIKLNGNRSHDIKVREKHVNKLAERILKEGSIGVGESYMDGLWDSDALDELFYLVFVNDINKDVLRNWRLWKEIFIAKLKSLSYNSQKRRAFEIGEKHYDHGNELFKHMLGKTMTYSCGYWKGAKNIDQAQINKLELCCKKLGIKKGDKVLEIGCGWGSWLKYAAKRYKIKGVGLTVSKEQQSFARKNLKGLDVDIRLEDYHNLLKEKEKFDHVISIGMFEHVGPKNYRTYMKIVSKILKPGGKFLLHTIGSKKSNTRGDPWMERYIFPNGVLPSLRQIRKSSKNVLYAWDVHNIGLHYDTTLISWWKNFDKNWKKIKKIEPKKYDDRFYRMWKFYLLTCAGNFRAEKILVWQILYSNVKKPKDYVNIR